MSQNTPPGNDPRQDDDAYRQEGTAQEPGNPYYNRVQPQDAPDLDASAPQLRTAEERRLNRKALMFIGGILALVLLMGFLLLRKGRDDAEAPARGAEVSRPSTPDLPSVAPTVQTPPPMQADPIPMLPPPPMPDDMPMPMERNSRTIGEAPRMPSLLDRRIAATGSGGGGDPSERQAPVDPTLLALQQMNGRQAPEETRRGADVDDVSNAAFIRSPDALLVRGTYLRCVLETRIITDVAGFTSCLVTEPVYSINGRTLLLPKGSKIYGSYGGGPIGERVDVIWDRITTPNGIDVAMSSPGTDGLGGAGIPGQYTAHWGQRIASALMISLLADAFKYAAAENGPETTTVNSSGFAMQSPYESATARTMESLAQQAASQRRAPTVTVNQGTIINVYVAKDVDFSAVLARR
ncbi:secretion protein [Stenotrophomonas sp. Sa5BUN4]|jgi:type IV secretion system protein VirB10|uniref:Secretion protein n=1 Tax=Stenotrophomonas lacuserhaii TaxID=2760084 RepID=A0A8X8FQ07_9GAMM|nr:MULTISPECIES: TrbI/VirB10 family protein [Stenotrophomonas]KIP87342.1 secretion protein [Stenotrophomonas maltophilia]MBD7952770.1 secretion protein [Stenotrophomonas pennii]MBD8643363.1 secretion protein [Stenotrophomonas sp. CFBP 13724]MDY1032023.1 TrbI/VirB10 family protein [Stenotrophomonas sp. CFBP8980]